MGKTYKKQSLQYDDDFSGKRSGKSANSRKTRGMKTLNSYADEEYYNLDDDIFDDEVDIEDNIRIQHNKNTN